MKEEKFEGFGDDNDSSNNTIVMGDVVDDVKSDVDKAMTEEKDEETLKKFKNFGANRSYIIFDKKDIAHFIDLIGYHSRLGYDHYTLSFKLDTTEMEATGKVSLVYNNGNVFAKSVITVQFSGVMASQIISVDTLLRVFSASVGYLCMFEETNKEGSSDIYGYVFGGRAYLETVRVETDICTKEYLMEQLGSKVQKEYKVSHLFVNTLKMLYDIVRTGSRIEEKAIYFKGDFTYIYSGVVLGKFPGLGVDLTLQDIDISTLARFFFDATDEVTISDHDVFMKYTCNDRSVYLAKRSLELSDDMKYVDLKSESGITVNVGEVLSIVSFLLSLPNNVGSLDIAPSKKGVLLNCSQKAFDNSSNFDISGTATGEGITKVGISLDVLKTFLRVFKNKITLKTSSNKLYVSGQEGDIVIFGDL